MTNTQADYDYVLADIGYFIARQCDSDWEIEDSVINFIDLTYISEGEAYYTIDGKQYTVTKGDLLCIPKHSQRSAIPNPDKPMMCYPINFQLSDFEGNDVSLPFPLISHIGIVDHLIHLYQDLNLAWIEKKAGYILHSRAIFTSILYKLLCMLYYQNDKESIDPRIRKAINYITQHYTERINVNDLSSLTSLNPAYFGILFKENTGCSIKKYINQIKINHAENLLLSGEFTITEISQKCGFEDIFYFSKLFKSIKGYPPSQVSNYF